MFVTCHAASMGLSSVPSGLRAMHDPAALDPVGLLDATRERILSGGDVARAVDMLSDGLWGMRTDLPQEEWRQVIALVRAHPLLGLLHENPFTRRAFLKPRGHAADATLNDLLCYGWAATRAEEESPLGLALLARDVATPFAAAMRERRDFMAELIDQAAAAQPMPGILAASCGHLREALASGAVQQGRIGRLVALDPDAEALAVVDQAFPGLGVETVNCDIDLVLEGGMAAGSFDLVYAAGLYDGLGQRLARALTASFFALLRPGGRLVVGNFARGIADAAYLEAIGNWVPVCRDAAEMVDLAGGIDTGELALKRVYARHSADILYLELRRRGAVAG